VWQVLHLALVKWFTWVPRPGERFARASHILRDVSTENENLPLHFMPARSSKQRESAKRLGRIGGAGVKCIGTNENYLQTRFLPHYQWFMAVTDWGWREKLLLRGCFGFWANRNWFLGAKKEQFTGQKNVQKKFRKPLTGSLKSAIVAAHTVNT
jgi:hypothetical protein